MSFVDHIARCNNARLDEFEPWWIAGAQAGLVHREFAPELAARPDLFDRVDGGWRLAGRLATPSQRSEAVRAWQQEMRPRGFFAAWRDEDYPLTPALHLAPMMQMERAAVPSFGVRAFGVHLTGYVRRRDGLHVWVPRRSRSKPTYPGQLDNTVAGGQPVGIGLHDNVVKECGEEAGIPPEIARRAIAVGVIAYRHQSGATLKPDIMNCFDLELPDGFELRPADGEAESFELWPVQRVYETVRDTAEFKYNCNLALIDFFVRHGLIDADHPDYVAIATGLHAGLFPSAR